MFLKSLIATLTIAATPAWAQMMNTSLMGTGYWGGNQGCSYQQRPAQAMNTESDEVREIKEQLAELKQQINEKKSEKKKLDREVTHAKSDIQKSLADQYAEPVMQHMDGFRNCSEYKGFGQSDSGDSISGADSSEDGSIIFSNEDMPEGPPPSMAKSSRTKAAPGRGANSNMLNLQGFSLQEWQTYCDARKTGSVFTAVCDNSRFRADSGRSNAATCKKAINSYRTNAQKSSKLQDEIDDLNREVERANDDLKEARNDKSGTEGDVCIECMAKNNSYKYQNQQSDMTSLITNVALAGGAMYAGYKTNQMVSENNANLGYPTQTPSVLSYGYPFLAQGMYGALSGNSGQGGFGCGSSMGNMMGGMGMGSMGMGMGGMMGMTGMSGMTGAFGYPSSMMNMGMMGMSGGIYNGMGNMYGMNGMSNMYGMNGMNGMYGLNSMYTNPYSMNSMYGSNPYQYSAMNSLQQQMMMMNYQMSAYPYSTSGIFGNTGVGYTNGVYTGSTSTYISPTGLTNATTLPSGVITGSSYGSYGTSYLSPYSTSLSNSVTIPGVVPYPTTGTTTFSGLIYGTGR